MQLSIVTTLYHSEAYIDEFLRRVIRSARAITDDYEIIVVNDGSPDSSLKRALSYVERGEPVRVIDLTRNFGHHKAVMTGLAHSCGSYVFLIDCDLEEPPELLLEFWDELQQDHDLDVVFGVQKTRKGGWLERHVNGWFYSCFNALADFKLPENLVLARLMRRRFVDNLLLFKEIDILFAGICSLTGHKQKALDVQKGHKGITTYSASRKISMIVSAVTSFSARPLELIFYLGLLISVVASATICILLYLRFIVGLAIEGWTSVLGSIWLLGGLNLLTLGIIGIYISKIYYQAKQRPMTLIKADYSPLTFAPDAIECRPGEHGYTESLALNEVDRRIAGINTETGIATKVEETGANPRT